MTDATSPPAPLKQHLWVLLALVAVGLAWFSLVDFGNTVGVDEWAFLNAVAHGSVAHAADNRPLGLLAHLAAWNLLGPHPLAAQIFYLFVRLGTAFMIYGLVERYWRDRPLFAFTCAAVYLVLIVDSWLLLQPYALLTYPSALLLALVALFCYQQYEGDGAPRWLWLAPGLVAGFASAMMTEATLSLLTGLPVLMFIARRPPTRGRFIGLGVWLITAIGAAIRYVAPVLGLSGATYASRMLVSLTPGYLIGNLLAQISIAFKDLVLAEPALIYRHALAAAVMAATMLIGMAAASRYLPTDEPTLPGRPAWQRHLVWLGIGLAAMLLGLALFLPTVIARDPRAQVLALPGGAVILASVVWLAGELVGAHLRSGVRYAAVVAMAVTSATRTAAIQDELYFYGGTWETQAIYLRTLAHIAPAVRDNTLFAYIEQPQQAEVPFVSGWAFLYALRYLYHDHAAGFIDRDTLLFHVVAVSDEGIAVRPDDILAHQRYVGTVDAFYRWDEIIFISKDERGQPVILEEIPPPYYTEARAALYDPYARIEPGFVSARVREILPPIQSPTEMVVPP